MRSKSSTLSLHDRNATVVLDRHERRSVSPTGLAKLSPKLSPGRPGGKWMDRKTLVILDAGGGIAIGSPTGGRGTGKVGVEETAGSREPPQGPPAPGGAGGAPPHKHALDTARFACEGGWTIAVGW